MRGLLVRFVRLLVRLFYRRLEVTGLESVPAAGPVLLAANHANGLVDPMLVMAALERPVVFVAKSTLWKIPLLGNVLDALGVVPVVRKADVQAEGETGDADRNEDSFRRLAGVLRGGGAVLIFPEGRSHSEPALAGIRTGAARVLLRAGGDVPAVPLGIWFKRKEEFRSDVLLRFGSPVRPAGERTVEAWTEAIRDGLLSATLNAESWEDHEAANAVEAIWGERLTDGPPGLERSFRSRQLLLLARPVLERAEPGAVARLSRRARMYVRLLSRAGLTPRQLDSGAAASAAALLRALAFLALGSPFAAVGIAALFVPYRLTGWLANAVLRGRDELDQLALNKLLAGLVLHPAALALEASLAFRLGGFPAALAAAAILPAAGLFALIYLETWEQGERRLAALLGLLFAPDRIGRLRRERDLLRAECDRLAEVYRHGAAAGDNPGR